MENELLVIIPTFHKRVKYIPHVEEALNNNFNLKAPRAYISDIQIGSLSSPVFVSKKKEWAEILLDGSFNKSLYQPEDIGLLVANRNSSLDTDIRYFETVKTMASPALFVYTLPNIVLGEICIRHQFKGENDFFIFENFNAAFIQQYTAHLFATGAMQACICGWIETMDNDYKACLFLIEKKGTDNALAFTEENITHIYQGTTHGKVNDRSEKTDC